MPAASSCPTLSDTDAWECFGGFVRRMCIPCQPATSLRTPNVKFSSERHDAVKENFHVSLSLEH